MTSSIAPKWADLQLSEDHVAELEASAITPEIAEKHGVHTVSEETDLPPGLSWVGRRPGALPALLHPLHDARGLDVFQIKPQAGSVVDDSGDELKYVSERADRAPVIIVRREVDKPKYVVIGEGTKQSLALDTWAPEDVSVYAIAGITGWSRGGRAPGELLEIVSHRDVIIWPDADASTNRAVYDGALALGDTAKAFGANTVHYARTPGMGQTGIDDVLASLPEDKRTTFIGDALRRASRKPADNKPAEKRKKSRKALQTTGSRRLIPLDASDHYDVVQALLAVLKDKAGDTLFFANNTLVQTRRDEDGQLRLRTVDKGVLQQIVVEHARVVRPGDRGDVGMPVPAALIDTLLAYADEFPRLEGIVTAPVYTEDMRLIIKPGYDAGTKLLLNLDPALNGLVVPEPTADSVAEACALLTKWLGDFPFKETADYANYLGFLLTPLVRPACPLVPAFAISANGKGHGKSLLAEIASQVLAGEDARTAVFPSGEEEVAKRLTSMLASGQTTVFFDETPEVDSATLNGLLTSTRFSGRILGETREVTWKNTITFAFAANNIKILGDARRRFVMSKLHSAVLNPSDRSGFAIEDLRSWTTEHRAELLTALLTLVEWWKAQGQPRPSNPPLRFGSFESWQDIVSGVLECAGIEGHLENVKSMRETSDWASEQVYRHLAWLQRVFGAKKFLVRDAYARLAGDVAGETLPGLERDVNTSLLGREYGKIVDIWYKNLRIVDAGGAGGGRRYWRVEQPPATGGGPSGPGGTPPPPSPVVSPTAPSPITKHEYPVEHGRQVPNLVDVDEGKARSIMFFDLETHDADDLYTYEGDCFIRLAAWAVDDGPVETTADIDDFVKTLRRHVAAEGLVAAHNGVAFDLAALERHHGLNVTELIENNQVRDTLLMARQTDPPGSGNADAKRYGLDALATRLLSAGKITSEGRSALKKLADEHGGFGAIPVNDPSYLAYAKQDVELLRGLFQYLKCDAYVLEEHCRMWALTAISRHGWRVDVDATESQIRDDRCRDEVLTEQLRGRLEAVTDTEIIGSPFRTDAGKKALADALMHHGVSEADVPRTKSGKPSTKADDLAALAVKYSGQDEVVWLCETVRALVSTRSTPVTIRENTRKDGRVHPSVSATQATGRISVTRPGLTVMGSRKRENLLERRLLLPDTDDQVLISCDLSGIDGRAMAVMSQDQKYLASYAPGVDVHAQAALDLFGDQSRRADAKVINHGLNYGMGATRLADELGVEAVEAKAILKRIQMSYPALDAFKERVRIQATASGLLKTPVGRWVRVDPNHSYTQAPAALGQGLARDLLMVGILRLPAELRARIRGIIHDEIVLSVPADLGDKMREEVLTALQFTYQLPDQPESAPVEVLADVSELGRDWAECYADEHPEWPEIRRAHRSQPACDDRNCAWHRRDERAEAEAA